VPRPLHISPQARIAAPRDEKACQWRAITLHTHPATALRLLRLANFACSCAARRLQRQCCATTSKASPQLCVCQAWPTRCRTCSCFKPVLTGVVTARNTRHGSTACVFGRARDCHARRQACPASDASAPSMQPPLLQMQALCLARRLHALGAHACSCGSTPYPRRRPNPRTRLLAAAAATVACSCRQAVSLRRLCSDKRTPGRFWPPIM